MPYFDDPEIIFLYLLLVASVVSLFVLSFKLFGALFRPPRFPHFKPLRRCRPRKTLRRTITGRAFITGTAYVTDGDGITVSGHTIRLAGLDAPEWDQLSKHQHGYWFNHGNLVKSALIEAIGGKYVQVRVEGVDKYGRLLGTVMCDDKDVGAWLVGNGLAISAYGDKYRDIERQARFARRGLWAHAKVYDPAAWRRRTTGALS